MGSRIAASLSRQSEVIRGRETLAAEFRRLTAEFGDGPIPLPEYWGGYRVVPDGSSSGRGVEPTPRPTPLSPQGDGWIIERLSP